jgi:hypothetical protein
MGPPWDKDHRMALAASIVAGDDGAGRSSPAADKASETTGTIVNLTMVSFDD